MKKGKREGFESVDWKTFGLPFVAGVDEVGRGCLAGPVYASAVILPPDFELTSITDSKLIKPEVRTKLAIRIRENAVAWAIGISTVEEIEIYNISGASLLAMKRAVESLKQQPQLVLVDGNQKIPRLLISQETLIKGDLRCAPISCASIIAKVARDEFMESQESQFPGYEFGVHKGYGTPKHKELIRKHGPTALHRKSFGGVREFFQMEK